MERGLLWLPLLALFIGLARAGWNEFQKVESYRAWGKDFRYAKYDIYSVLGLGKDALMIGKPSPKGPVALQRVSLGQIQAVALRLDGALVAWDDALALLENEGGRKGGPQPKAIAIELDLGGDTLQIPFTQLDLAVDWTQRLKQELAQGNA
jgi:hypothetical protein